MSVVDNKTVDGVALTDDKKGIILLITDHLEWKDEYQHLIMLQAKINAYISFLEEKQYKDIYQDMSIMYGIIEIHFLHCLSKNAEKFLHSVNNQLNDWLFKKILVILNNYCRKVVQICREPQRILW